MDDSMNQRIARLTVDRLKEVLDYSETTGLFTRRVQLGARAVVGVVAGSVSKSDGRRRIKVDKEQFFAARMAWFYVHGEWPNGEVDHVNMIRDDDRISNLRIATHQQNNANRRALRNSRLGVKGVSKVNNRYRAKLNVAGRSVHLGYYNTPDEANLAYAAAAKSHFGEFAREA